MATKTQSNQRMEHNDDTAARLEALEIKASFTEDLVEQLNLVIYRQQQQIDGLIQQVANLREQSPDGAGGRRSMRDELPPHY